ncbi:hypothetical protein VPH49_22135 [Pseudomonas luteola]|uniref:hypothetical protein n=1 Tax=Pseudomonas luteola TaxID=47886 RepID=UPI003A8C139A
MLSKIRSLLNKNPQPNAAYAVVSTEGIVGQAKEIERLEAALAVASAAQSTFDRRLNVFRREHPELWAQYFSKAGSHEKTA